MYKIIGADGKEYGPIAADVLRKWIIDGRANAQTRVLLEGASEWRTVADFPELAAALPGNVYAPGGITPLNTVPTAPALEQVSGPGIALIIVGAFCVLPGILRILSGLFGLTFGSALIRQNPELEPLMAASGVLNAAMGGLILILAALIIWGGIKMRKLESYSMCMTAAIIALLPCTCPCCLFSLPIGIWALVILCKPEVKAAFR